MNDMCNLCGSECWDGDNGVCGYCREECDVCTDCNDAYPKGSGEVVNGVCCNCNPGLHAENFQFDKFIDDIVIKESKKLVSKNVEDSPQLKYNKRYRETAANRIKVNGGK